ncbi:hypothetical protein [Aestuariimicrobium ganziense]|uniref:hypothetical protein n=1 Tax=Aestuariimicrobium ganziense TaxID=2773677 RepID=UPI0019423596|nr:hypothetical protein [Aestuariimicrobium ganziense]
MVASRLPESAALVIALALVTWTLRMLHQTACNTNEVELNTMLRLCYSDLPVLWRDGGLGSGGVPYRGASLDQPPLIALWVLLTQRLTFLVAPLEPVAPRSLEGDTTFFVSLNVLLLGGAFLVLVVAHLLLSRRHPHPPTELTLEGLGRIGLFTALSVGVFTAGTISWALVPAALVAVALVLWASRRVAVAGVVLGLAASAAWYPLMLLVALWILCRRADRLRDWSTFAMTTMATWVVINLPIVLVAPQGWLLQARTAMAPEVGLGSVWHVLQQATGVTLRVWPLSWLLVAVAVAAVTALCWWAPRRPRLAQVFALLVLAITVTAPVYSPQHVIWIAPLALLARPVLLDWLVFSLVEAVYWAAVWGHLQGNLWGGGPFGAYSAAILLRVAVQVWLMARIIADIRSPWYDPVRSGHVDDPLGGVLDHTTDRAPDEVLHLQDSLGALGDDPVDDDALVAGGPAVDDPAPTGEAAR